MEEHLKEEKSQIVIIKELRQEIDSVIQRVKCIEPCREVSICITKLQEAVMWLGMDLKRLGNPNPYPGSKDPNSGDIIHPTADGLKM